MTLKKMEGGWWITNVPTYVSYGKEYDSYGPYETRKEAEEIKQGVLRAMQDNPDIFGK